MMDDDDREFDARAEAHGFSELEAEFLRTYLSRPGHEHTIDQIVFPGGAGMDGFDDAVSDILDEALDEDND